MVVICYLLLILKKFSFAEIMKILAFLEVPVDQNRLFCTLQSLEGEYHRKSDPEKRPFPFKNHQVLSLSIPSYVCFFKFGPRLSSFVF